jgi:hypothetical protein
MLTRVLALTFFIWTLAALVLIDFNCSEGTWLDALELSLPDTIRRLEQERLRAEVLEAELEALRPRGGGKQIRGGAGGMAGQGKMVSIRKMVSI